MCVFVVALLVSPDVTPSMRTRVALEAALGMPVHWAKTTASALRRLKGPVQLLLFPEGHQPDDAVLEAAARRHGLRVVPVGAATAGSAAAPVRFDAAPR